MKKTYKFIPLLFIAIAIMGIYSSCTKDDSGSTNGVPRIDYVRVTDPLKSDSLLVQAFQSSLIAIMGENLAGAQQIWFNDQRASLTPTYITNTTILVNVPALIPVVIDNKLKIVFSNGDTLKYDFKVQIPAPSIASMLCEYVPDGGTAVIKGNYFIDDPSSPLTVIFPGNIPGQILSFTLNEIKVKVPTGVGVGPIVVKSIYGSTRSSLYFRDDRNIILDFDVLTAAGGWRAGKTANTDPAGIDGNYVRFSGAMAAASGATWDEDSFSFDLWGTANGRPQGDLFSIDPSLACIKFEVNVDKEWKSGALQMIFTPWGTTGTNSYIADATIPRGLWIPWKDSGTYSTNGWVTITIALSDFKYGPDGKTLALASAGNYGGLTFFVYNGGVAGTACTPDICIDNIRVVPIK
jgi:hypothetical protein